MGCSGCGRKWEECKCQEESDALFSEFTRSTTGPLDVGVSLRWSKNRPTETGVYLFREKGASKKSVRLVVIFAWREWQNSRKKKLSDLRGRFDIQEISYPLGSNFFDGEFAGPINVEEAN